MGCCDHACQTVTSNSDAREAISQLRKEMEFVASKNTVLTVGKAELFLD